MRAIAKSGYKQAINNVLNSLLSTATKMEKAFLLIFTDCLTDGTLVHTLTSMVRYRRGSRYSFGHFRTRRMRCKREVESDLAM